jgi:fluoride ion exporter CrcB/FEX
VVQTLIAIALGSALGGVLRYLAGAMVHVWLARTFPWGTLGVNVLGSTLIGLCWVLLATRGEQGELLVEQQGYGRAGAYGLASVLLCLTGAWAGLNLGRQWIQ